MELDKLKAIVAAVEGWEDCNKAWLDHSDDEAVATVGHIDEEGNTYPVAVVDCGQYGKGADSVKLAKFYAAANPAVVMRLIIEVERAERVRDAERVLREARHRAMPDRELRKVIAALMRLKKARKAEQEALDVAEKSHDELVELWFNTPNRDSLERVYPVGMRPMRADEVSPRRSEALRRIAEEITRAEKSALEALERAEENRSRKVGCYKSRT